MSRTPSTLRPRRALTTWVPEATAETAKQKVSQDRLSDSLERLRLAMEPHSVTLLQLDREGHILFANRDPAAERLGTPLSALLRSPATFERHHREALERTTEFELVFLQGDSLFCRATPLRLEGGVVGTILLGRSPERSGSY